MADLTLTGATAGQAFSDATTIAPFAGLTVASSASATPNATAVVTLSSTANGALSHLGVGALSPDGATYTVSGSPALVQAALRGLVFTPIAHEVAVGQSVTIGFGLTVSDASGSATNNATSVVATAADTAPTITDTSAAHAPTVLKLATVRGARLVVTRLESAFPRLAEPPPAGVQRREAFGARLTDAEAARACCGPPSHFPFPLQRTRASVPRSRQRTSRVYAAVAVRRSTALHLVTTELCTAATLLETA